jgi:hypothetical protein
MEEAIGVGRFLKGGAEHDTTVQDVNWPQFGSPDASALQPALHVGKVIGDGAIAWPRDLDAAHHRLTICPGRLPVGWNTTRIGRIPPILIRPPFPEPRIIDDACAEQDQSRHHSAALRVTDLV